MPREWIASTGEIAGFTGNIVRDVWGLRVFRFFGEGLRQAGILIVSSTLIIWTLMFILGLQCGIEGAYFTEAQGAPAYSGVFTAWCDLREITPYAFGYMMSAKVGTGIVAELGAMRISEEIDALEVMGIDSMTFLCATRLLAAWIVLPFIYLAGDRGRVPRLLPRRRAADRVRLLGGVSADLLAVPGSARLPVQPHQGDVHGHRDRAGGVLLRLQRQWWARRRGPSDGQVDGAQHRARAHHRHARHASVLGLQPASPDRGLTVTSEPLPPASPGEEAGTAEPVEVKQDAIEFIDVHKAFGRNQVLRGLNMSLPDEQISMILGPSGTGKSVCIKHIVGLLYPDQGDVLVQGRSIPSLSDAELFEIRKKFGVLFQDGALFGSINLYDNVAFPLRQHTEKGDEEIAEIVNRRLREVGLGNAGTKMPNELSGGMRKRAGFARSLVLEPEIVLFDEPDSGLDPVRTALLCELIKEVHAENGGCYVVITHDIMSARRVAEHIAVLWQGEIVQSGPAAELFASENPFVRQFLAGDAAGPLGME